MKEKFGWFVMAVILSVAAYAVAGQVVSSTVVQRPLSDFGYSAGIGVGTEWPTVTNSFKGPKDGEVFIKVGTDPSATEPQIGVYSEKLGAFVTGKVLIPDGTTTAPSLAFADDTDTGIYSPVDGVLDINQNGSLRTRFNSSGSNFYLGASTQIAAFDSSSTSGDTRFKIYDVDNAALERVTVGAADSGGSGYKVLRIAN